TDPSFASISLEKLAALPQVAATAPLVGYTSTDPDLNPVAAPDGRYGSEIGRHKILSGRQPARPDEVMVSFVVAEARHLRVGSRLTLHLVPRAVDPDAEPGPPEPIRVRVVGIEAGAGEFPPQTQTGFKIVWFSPA